MTTSFFSKRRCFMCIAIILCSVLLVGVISAQTSVNVTISGTVIKQPTQCDIFGKDHIKKPSALFLHAPKRGLAPLTVTFIDISNKAPTSWNWSFGDGTFSNERNPKHTYNQAGLYRAVLTVENCAGTGKMERYVWVFPRWWIR